MKRKRIRKIILISILIVSVISGLYRLSVEPSDYNKAISKQISKANKLLAEANLGNDKGDYSKNNIIKMKNSVAEAEALIETEAPDIDDLRKQYKKIREDIKEFKNSYNNNCLSKSDVEKLKKENKSFKDKVDLETNKKAVWNIHGSKIKQIKPINLDIEKDTVYEDFIKQIAKDNNMNITILSFRHNGDLPVESNIKLQISLEKGKKYLYKYDDISDHLIYKSELKFKDGNTTFSVDEGGDWVISDKKLKVAKLARNEIIDDSDAKDEKNKKDEKDKKDELEKNENKNNTENGKLNTVSTNDGTKKKNGKSQNTSTNKSKGEKKYCIIEIRCDTILNNMDRLPKGKEKYIPKDGIILPKTRVEVKDGECVFDVLKRVTRSKGIQMEFRNDPLYSGAYVEGINHLYEFDGGELSGWMYKVDGWFPEYGCSRYIVNSGKNRDRPGKTNGEVISWVYTCNLGKDVGDQDYWKYDNE